MLDWRVPRHAFHGINEAIPGVRDKLDIVGVESGLLSLHASSITRAGGIRSHNPLWGRRFSRINVGPGVAIPAPTPRDPKSRHETLSPHTARGSAEEPAL